MSLLVSYQFSRIHAGVVFVSAPPCCRPGPVLTPAPAVIRRAFYLIIIKAEGPGYALPARLSFISQQPCLQIEGRERSSLMESRLFASGVNAEKHQDPHVHDASIAAGGERLPVLPNNMSVFFSLNNNNIFKI